MNWASLILNHWLTCFLLILSLYFGGKCWYRFKRQIQITRTVLSSFIILGLMGLGGITAWGLEYSGRVDFPAHWALGLSTLALLLLFAGLLFTVMTGRWWAPLGYTLGGFFFLGLGGFLCDTLGRGTIEGVRTLSRLEAVSPLWLLCLAFIPTIFYLSFRSLAGLGPVRRWIALGLRCFLILLLSLALAEVRLRYENENVTALFLIDRSLSIPEDYEVSNGATNTQPRVDRRWERIKKFINESVANRGPGHEQDKAGVIAFARRPRLELPPSDTPRLNFAKLSGSLDNNYTDIGAALKLALASFPEGSAKRIVLISDGNENLGNAEEQARIARLNGAQIDVVPIVYKNENEVMVPGVEAPSVVEQSSQLPIRVLIRNQNPHRVSGTLTLRQVTDGNGILVSPSPVQVVLEPGLNTRKFQKALGNRQQSYSYEATFQPELVLNDKGEPLPRETAALLASDRVQNNRATTHVLALGQRRVLLIEAKAGEHEYLVDTLRSVGGRSRFKVHSITAAQLPSEKENLGVFLSNYDCVILANVPAELLNEEQQEMIRSNTHDQGCGFIMIGGPDSFGAGGWQNTAIEKALPVDCEKKSIQIQGKGGLVLIMHASEMAEGNRWQKEIAKLAVKRLSSIDMLGMLYYDWMAGGGHRWHIPFQTVGQKRNSMLRLVEQMNPGDMPDVDPALSKAFDALTKTENNLATRHIIFISDGDHWTASPALLAKLRANKITCTTVCITTHGKAEEIKMGQVAAATKGHFYNVKNPNALPSIYIQESRVVSQTLVFEKRFQPNLLFKSGPTEKMPNVLNPLYGYVRTTAKVAPTVQTSIMAPPQGDLQFPVLAYWPYGLGRSVAFTSDARSKPEHPGWDKDWAGSDIYLKFWEQVVNWALRAVETGKLSIRSEYADGQVRVIVDARDKENHPLTDLDIQGGITLPGTGPNDHEKPRPPLKFEQTNSGFYEAKFKADEAGSYFINAQATRKSAVVKNGKEVETEEKDSIRAGITVPYSPEFADLESNVALLKKVQTMTGGAAYEDSDESLEAAAKTAQVFRRGDLPSSKSLQPVWYWLLLLTGVLLFFDVGVRRLSIEPVEVVHVGQKWWGRIRGRTEKADTTPQFLDRLKTRKAQIGETLELTRSARRLEAPEGFFAPPPTLPTEATSQRPQPLKPPTPAAREDKEEKDSTDYASRLLKAKRKVWEEREKEK